jgi:hypothetical protein
MLIGYAAYLAHELMNNPRPWRVSGRRSDASAFNAFLGLLVFGVPGLLYALFGQVTWRNEPDESPASGSEDDCQAVTLLGSHLLSFLSALAAYAV